MAQTRTFKVSGLGCLGSVVLLLIAATGFLEDPLQVLGILGIVVLGPVFAVSATRALLRGILWRVGSRLFISYVLIGVVPVPVVLMIVSLGVWMVAGQMAVRRAESAFTAQRIALRTAAQSAVHDPRGAVETAGATLPGLGWAFLPTGGAVEGSGPIAAAEVSSRSWLKDRSDGAPGFLARRRSTLLACEVVNGPTGRLVLYLPLSAPLETSLSKQLGADLSLHAMRVSRTEKGERRQNGRGKTGISIKDRGKETNVEIVDEEVTDDIPEGKREAPPPEGTGPISGRFVTWMMLVPEPLVDWESGQPRPHESLGLVIRSSLVREYRELFGEARIGDDETPSGRLVLMILRGVAAFGAGVYLVAALLAGILVFRIARAARRLSLAFQELARGNFAHRAPPLRGRDQLAALIVGFNGMAAHLQESVAERAEKEALEHELQVARDLQRRLLPSPDFRFPGVEIASDFHPAAAIGGDFYYLAAEGAERLVVAIADVSGHGLPTGIVMASARASLAALSQSGVPAADLFETLDREIRDSTDSRTFVTLAHARFRMSDSLVELTNAGHIYPYRVQTDGTVSSVKNPARPLGLTLPGGFTTMTSPIAAGDHWVFLSDGIVEGLAAGSDDEFGFVRLERILSQGAGRSAAALRDLVLQEWRSFTRRDEPEDDRTLIVLQLQRVGGASVAPPQS